MNKLSDKQIRFVKEYLVDLNATQAAIRAGYSPKRADAIGYENLRKPDIAALIQGEMEKRSARTEITQDMVLRELAKLGFSNMMDYIKVQSDGTAYTDLSSLTREQAAAIQEITVDEYVEGRGDEARIVKKVKIKLSEKRGSLELIGRHLGMFPTRITGADGGPVQIQEAPSIDVSKLEPGEAQALLDLMEKATARPNKGGNS